MHRSLDFYAPKWAVGRIVEKSCRCGHKFQRTDIVQIGIRKINRQNGITEALAIELACPSCQEKKMATFFDEQRSFRELLCVLLEEVQKNDRLEMSKDLEHYETNQSGITKQEVDDFVKKLNSMENYEDLLKELGYENTDENK